MDPGLSSQMISSNLIEDGIDGIHLPTYQFHSSHESEPIQMSNVLN